MACTPAAVRSKVSALLVALGGIAFLLWFPGNCLRHGETWLAEVQLEAAREASLRDASPAQLSALAAPRSAAGAAAPVPEKWTSDGGPNPDYEMGGNPAAMHGSEGGGYIRSITQEPKAFGNLMTHVAPGPFLGTRVRLSAYVRTEGLAKDVVLWIRVDGPNGRLLHLDNRPITGTTAWKKYELVTDVPTTAVNVAFGIILDGFGQAWLDGVLLETVSTGVPTTTHPAWLPTGANPEDYEMGGCPGRTSTWVWRIC